ncbi:type IX secretion system protein PorM/GldM [Tenacibaculum sp. M341]|uniref:type IX secretion system motor protein PorM/GldM n=1 Tax=Tenacibaculum sp. M341 TaxID=2530339 RepID=UPI001042FB08|nr:gliding motility protein GldM [Tenacibaculum sp. M341]TCI91403.1 gliding motility protein GldM [Tenacibaculum sp. M341]
MAGGKQSPRQKMINLMYLVFLAMMAMNMGKEVLSAFGLMNEKLTDANRRATETNAAAYANLATKAAEQAKQYGEAKEKTDVLKARANELYVYLDDLKSKMTADVEDKKDYELMDKSSYLDSYFFESGTISPNGKEFVSKVDEFRKAALEVLGETDLGTVVESRFDTNPVKNREGLQLNWLNYNYEGFPLIASLTKLTQIQADIKATESDALSKLLQGELESAVSMTNYDAMVVFDKNAYYPGEKLSGRIVLGKNDPNLTAEKVVINGKDWPEDKIKAGQVILDGPAGSVGDRDIKGSFFFKENDSLVEIPIKGGYSVIPRPNEAVISADKMNAVYRGLSNPMTISMPGVPSNKVSASAPGLRKKSGDSYVMTPGKGSEVTIRVTGVLPGGNKVSSNKKFRIKDIPPAVGAVRGQYGTVSMPKGSVGNVTVGALLPDFLFDLKLKVSSFKIKVPGQPAVPVTGTRMSSRAKKAISKARRGEVINIFDIKATVSGSGAPVKKVVGVGIKVSN